MRISDWSSDVCSSDLGRLPPGADKEIAVAPARHRAWLALAMPLVLSVFAPDAAAQSEAQPAAVAGSELTRTSGALERLDDVDTLLSLTSEGRSEEHTSELQSLMRISYDVFCLKKKKTTRTHTITDSEATYRNESTCQPHRAQNLPSKPA